MRIGNTKSTCAATATILVLAASLAVLSSGSSAAAGITVIDRASGLPSEWVRALAAAGGGKIWIGTGDRGIALWDPSGGTVRAFSEEPAFSSGEITSIARFQEKVYAGTSRELVVYDGRTWQRLDRTGNVTLRNITLAVSPDGKELWAAAMSLAGGTVKFDGSRWVFMGGDGRGLFNDIDSFAFDERGTWMGSISGTVYLHKGSAGVDFFAGGIEGNVSSLAIAGDTLYAGTNRGLFRLDGSAWKAVPLPGEWGKVVVYSMSAKGGVLYLGTSAGLVRSAGRRTDRLTEAEGLPDRKVNAVLAVDDAVYAGTMKGLAAVRGW